LANDLLPIFHLQQKHKYHIENFFTKQIQANTAKLVQKLSHDYVQVYLILFTNLSN